MEFKCAKGDLCITSYSRDPRTWKYILKKFIPKCWSYFFSPTFFPRKHCAAFLGISDPRRNAPWRWLCGAVLSQHSPTGLWKSAFNHTAVNFDRKFQCHLFLYLASGRKFTFPKEDGSWELQGALQFWAVTQEQEHNTLLLVRAMSPSPGHPLPLSMEGKPAALEPHLYIWNPMDMLKSGMYFWRHLQMTPRCKTVNRKRKYGTKT